MAKTQSLMFLSWVTSKLLQHKRAFFVLCVVLTFILYQTGGKPPTLGSSQSLSEQHRHGVSFAVIGDWGAKPEINANQTQVANAMLLIHQRYQLGFVVSVGDHFYDHGVLCPFSPRWRVGFEDIYHPSLSPWYVAYGNHDMRGSIKAQIEYATKSKRWISPATFYYKDFAIDSAEKGNAQFRMIFIDSNNLMCNHDEHEMLDELEKHECDEMFYNRPTDMVEAHGANVTLESATQMQSYNFAISCTQQLQWLNETVRAAEQDPHIQFVFIVAHHALFSQGPHGIPTLFNRRLAPILRASKKTVAYFCGHNHVLEHYAWDKHKIRGMNVLHEIVSGSGGREVHATNLAAPIESQLEDVKLGFLGKAFGFVTVHIDDTRSRITVKYWDKTALLLYSFDIHYTE